MVLSSLLPSRGKSVNQCWREMYASPTERSWCVLKFARCNSFVISSCGVSLRTTFTSHHFQRHYQNCESASTPHLETSHKTCLRGFGRNGSIAWTYAVSHVGRTSNAFKFTIRLQKFLFQMVVKSCICVQYLWKYCFAKYSYNLYSPCVLELLRNIRMQRNRIKRG
jgi:hypothetical protein